MSQDLVSPSPTFDYSSLAPELADDARAVAQRVRAGHLRTMQTILEMGRELLGLKARLGHGRFGRWLEAEFGAVARTAQNYMLAAERFGGTPELISLLPPATVYALAAPSTPELVRAEVVRRLSEGERLGSAEVGAMVRAGRDAGRREKEASAGARTASHAERQLEQSELHGGERRTLEPSGQVAQRSEALGELVTLLRDGLGNDFQQCLSLMREAGLGWAADRIAGQASGGADPSPSQTWEPASQRRQASGLI